MGYLTYLKFQIENSREEILADSARIVERLTDSLKNVDLERFYNQNHSLTIEMLVSGRFSEGYVKKSNVNVLKSGSPVYMMPESKIGRAAFFSANKRFYDRYFETLRFNLSVIWILNFFLYIFLIGDFTRVIFNIFRKQKLNKI